MWADSARQHCTDGLLLTWGGLRPRGGWAAWILAVVVIAAMVRDGGGLVVVQGNATLLQVEAEDTDTLGQALRELGAPLEWSFVMPQALAGLPSVGVGPPTTGTSVSSQGGTSSDRPPTVLADGSLAATPVQGALTAATAPPQGPSTASDAPSQRGVARGSGPAQPPQRYDNERARLTVGSVVVSCTIAKANATWECVGLFARSRAKRPMGRALNL